MYNLNNSHTARHGHQLLYQDKGQPAQVYKVKDDLPDMIKVRWVNGQTRTLVKFCSILVGKVPTLSWMSNNIFGVIKDQVTEDKIKVSAVNTRPLSTRILLQRLLFLLLLFLILIYLFLFFSVLFFNC